MGRTVPLSLLAAAAATAITMGCGGDKSSGAGDGIRLQVEHTVEFESDSEPVALTPLRDGGLLVGERRTGAVRRISAAGDLSDPIVRVAVQAGTTDQRGLFGLAVDGDRIYGAWTRAIDDRIVVAEITDGVERLVWEGPASGDLANGGHLALLPDDRLIIGIGDLQDPDRAADPDSPNGKLLTLDPAGPPQQEPTSLSDGWNNPFAFVITRSGAVWVADNAPGDDPERIGRGDERADRTALPGSRAPSALIELEPGRLGLCGYLDGQISIIDIDADEPRVVDVAATGCRTGAVGLTDGRFAVSDGDKVRILART